MPKRERKHRLRKKREQKTKEAICNRYHLDRIIDKIIILKVSTKSKQTKKELITGQLIGYRLYRYNCKYICYELALLVNGQDLQYYFISDDERLKNKHRLYTTYSDFQLAKIKKILTQTEELLFKLEHNV